MAEQRSNSDIRAFLSSQNIDQIKWFSEFLWNFIIIAQKMYYMCIITLSVDKL